MPSPPKTSAAAVLQAAIDLIETEGWEALSLRALARRLGLQVTSLYHHFADKAALEDALGREAARLLHEQLAARSVRGDIERMAKSYRRFALQHPGLYQLIAARPSSSDSSPEAKAVWNLLLEAVSSRSAKPDDTAAAVAVWSFLHGFVALESAAKFGPSGSHGAFEHGLRAMLIGFQPQARTPRSPLRGSHMTR